MNRDILKGRWTHLRGMIKQWWGELTHNDVERIDGKFDRIIGRVQERAGQLQEHARRRY